MGELSPSYFLALDLGNTSLHVGVFRAGHLVFEGKIPTSQLDQLPQWWDRHLSSFSFSHSALASVNPKVTHQVRSDLTKLGLSPLRIGRDIPYPIELNVDNPSQVGIDRVVNAFMGQKKYGTPCLIVDFGTAITIDVVSEKGVYEGGIIAPGLKLSARSLFEGTALLPLIHVQSQPPVVGKNTQEAMSSGIFWGAVGMVEIWVAKVKEEKDWPEVSVVATGGDSPLLAPHCSSITHMDPFLTLEGIYQLTQEFLSASS